MSDEKIQNIIKELLVELGEDPQREGLAKTPQRVAKSFKTLFGGYDRDLGKELTLFENKYNYDDIIYSGSINFFSTCEHHLLPFYGKAHIAYIPGDKIIGLSKLARAVDIYARRLQDQERITTQVATEIIELTGAKGVAVMLEAKHFCNMARGVNQTESSMKTFAFKGDFASGENLRTRFMSMID
jgi:GTP cyclohydrolase I